MVAKVAVVQGELVAQDAATNVIVAPLGQGGDYTSIKAAVDAITDASATKPYGIIVYPGIYAENSGCGF